MFFRRKNTIDTLREESVSSQTWRGLQPMTVLDRPADHATHLVTCRLRGKPADYIRGSFCFQGSRWIVTGVQWGKNAKFVGLEVQRMGPAR